MFDKLCKDNRLDDLRYILYEQSLDKDLKQFDMAKYKDKSHHIVDAIRLTPNNYEDVCDFVGEGLQQILAPRAITYPDGTTTPYRGVWIGNSSLGYHVLVGMYLFKDEDERLHAWSKDVFECNFEKL